MAVTIVATAGAADANSFLSLASAELYVEGRWPSPATWAAASTDDKNRALVSATRWLTTLPWQGDAVDDTQALAWPRQSVVNPDSPGSYLDTTVIPSRIANGTVELALAYIAGDTTDIGALDATEGVKRNKVDVLEKEYFEPHQRARDLDKYPAVTRWLAALLAPSAARGALTIVRG